MRRTIVVLVIMIVFSSCEKIFFKGNESSTSPQENLDYLWNQCDEKYAYFDLKGVDWNQVKLDYSAKIYSGMSDDSLFQVMGGMLRELKDDHTNLISNFNVSFFGASNQGPDNFEWRVITDNYLPSNYYISGPFTHDFLLNENIGYVRFAAFTGTVNDQNLDFVLERYKDTKGLILDLRENGGGAVSDVFKILSRFIDVQTTVYYSRLKNGPGHNDFTDPEPAIVSPSLKLRYLKKVVVLIDRGTFSAGSFTSLATMAIPSMILMGDTTGGGLGLPNGGQLPNGWTYRFSITQALDLHKNNQYENGVPPDIKALFDWNDLTRDEVIDLAVSEIK